MKKLVCELCGSNNFTKSEDFFTCDYCRTKYTPAQAKSIMVEGTVSLNRSSEVANLGILANLAIESHDYQLAHNYATRMLEIDATDPMAWFYRASAVGLSSTTQKPRLEEMIKGFESALDLAPEDARSELQSKCAVVLNDVCAGLMAATMKESVFSAMDHWRWTAYTQRCMALIHAFHKANSWKPGQIPLNHILTLGNSLVSGVQYPAGGTTVMGKPKMGHRRLESNAEHELRAYLDGIQRSIQTL